MNRYIFIPQTRAKRSRRYICYAETDEEAWASLRKDINLYQGWLLQEVDTIYGGSYDAGQE
jgi:hypothetical protein